MATGRSPICFVVVSRCYGEAMRVIDLLVELDITLRFGHEMVALALPFLFGFVSVGFNGIKYEAESDGCFRLVCDGVLWFLSGWI